MRVDPESFLAGRSPVVSVIIPAYEAADLIRGALDSVLAQSVTDVEIIVVNDGSPDTASLELALVPYREWIVYLWQQNGGPSAARNLGIRHARGEYVAFLDADDAWEPNFLAEQLQHFEADPKLDMVYCDALLVGTAEPSERSARIGRTFMALSPSQGEVTVESLLSGRCHVVTSTVVARRKRIVDVGMFDTTLRRSEDFDLWLRLAKSGARISYGRQVLVRRTIHANSLSADGLKMLEAAFGVFDDFSRRPDLTAEERRALEQAILKLQARRDLKRGKILLSQGDFVSAAAALRRSNTSVRTWKLKLALLLLRISPRLLTHCYVWREDMRRRRAAGRDRTSKQRLGADAV